MNLFKEPGGRANTAAEEVCWLLMALADLTLSLETSFREGPERGTTGASLALAECDRGLFTPVLVSMMIFCHKASYAPVLLAWLMV